jgi:multimeric flavodoxin WrbA
MECHGCDATGVCVVKDDMQSIYPKLTEADVIILASPIFFYGVTAWAKALVDRSQALWARKYLVKDPSLSKGEMKRKGFFISVGATKGGKLFEGAILTMKYFFDAIHVRYAGELLFRGIEAKDDILKHPEALEQALEMGRRLIQDP